MAFPGTGRLEPRTLGYRGRKDGRRDIRYPLYGPDRLAVAHVRHGPLRRRPQRHCFHVHPERQLYAGRQNTPGEQTVQKIRPAVRHGDRHFRRACRIRAAGEAGSPGRGCPDRRQHRMDGLRRDKLPAAGRPGLHRYDRRSFGQNRSSGSVSTGQSVRKQQSGPEQPSLRFDCRDNSLSDNSGRVNS